MHVPLWGIILAVVVMIIAAYGYGRLRTVSARRELARLQEQLEREQEFSSQLISLMPEDKEEPK